ncbi:MAG: hypothetical protein R3C19_19290 [Planctomycetaceae bacterium]
MKFCHTQSLRKYPAVGLMLVVVTFSGCRDPIAESSPSIPQWMQERITQLQQERDSNVPAFAQRATYDGRTVYYTSAAVPDGFGSLYDEDGTLLGHPDGGLNGKGDGRCSDYFEAATNVTTIWKAGP